MTGPAWRKSSYSGTQGDCVEIARIGMNVAVRDSKHAALGHLAMPRRDFAALLTEIKAGRLTD